MKLLIIGGDKRMYYSAEKLHESGYEVTTYGLMDSSHDTILSEAIKDADRIILPLPISKDKMTITAPMTNELIYLEDIIYCKPKFIYGGIINDSLKSRLNDDGIMYYDYYTDEPLTVKNAVLTAEAAVSIAINSSGFSLFNSNALVIGYGRIGKQLSYYLKALGANVTATSRDLGTRATIEADSFNNKDTKDVKEILEKFDFIFNTAPAPIMDRTFFSRCKQNCFVEDLATGANTDLIAAKEYGINANIYPGLPGKFFPLSAGKIIADTINNHILETYQF